MIFAKYLFPDKQIWDNHKKQITDKEGNPIECAIVEIGELTAGFAVDIMWFGEINESFNEYEVFPDPIGVHVFAGCQELYLERYNRFKSNSQ